MVNRGMQKWTDLGLLINISPITGSAALTEIPAFIYKESQTVKLAMASPGDKLTKGGLVHHTRESCIIYQVQSL